MSKHKVMSNGKAADRTDQRSSKQPSSGILGSGLLTWDSLAWDSCGQGRYGIGAAAAAGGAVGVALFDQVVLVGAVAGLGALAHFLSGWMMSDW
jgi:hypothetical protein